MVGGFLAYRWFAKSPVAVRLTIFGLIFGGIVAWGVAIRNVSALAKTNAPALPGQTVQQEVTYSGLIVDAGTLAGIRGAKVILSLAGATPGYTDSNGRYSIDAPPSSKVIRVRVYATNYDTYDELLPPGANNQFADIRLDVTRAVQGQDAGGNGKPIAAPTPSKGKRESSQSRGLSGTILDVVTDLPIRGATVTLTIDQEEPLHRETESTGVYVFNKVPANAEGVLRVTAPGYQPYDRRISAQTRPELRTIKLRRTQQ